MISLLAMHAIYLGGLLAAPTPDDFFQEKGDYYLFLNMCDTILLEDIAATPAALQEIKAAWHEGWRQHIVKSTEGFAWYDGKSRQEYWKASHQFLSRSTQAYALLEALSFEALAYVGAGEQVRLIPEQRKKSLLSICPSLGIEGIEVTRLEELLNKTGEEVAGNQWTAGVDAVITDITENPVSWIFPTWSLVYCLFHSEEPDTASMSIPKYALDVTKETVLYQTLIEDQEDRALAIKAMVKQEEEIKILRQLTDEQEEVLEDLKAVHANLSGEPAAAGSSGFVISSTPEVKKQEESVHNLEAKLSIAEKSLAVMKREE